MKLSVLTAVHNESARIETCLEHLSRQTYRDAEFLVRDDRSTDDTAAKVARWAARDPRIKLLRNEKNLGRVGQYRRLLHEDAKGDCVFIMNGDDFIEDADFFERMMAPFDEDPGLVASVGCTLVHLPGRPPGRVNRVALDRAGIDRHRILDRAALLDLLRRTPVLDNDGATIVRRSFAIEVGCYEKPFLPEVLTFQFLGPDDRVALVRSNGVVFTVWPGESETSLLGGRCGFDVALATRIMRYALKRPDLRTTDLVALSPRAWTSLRYGEIVEIWRKGLVPGMSLGDLATALRLKFHFTRRWRLARGAGAVAL